MTIYFRDLNFKCCSERFAKCLKSFNSLELESLNRKFLFIKTTTSTLTRKSYKDCRLQRKVKIISNFQFAMSFNILSSLVSSFTFLSEKGERREKRRKVKIQFKFFIVVHFFTFAKFKHINKKILKVKWNWKRQWVLLNFTFILSSLLLEVVNHPEKSCIR